MCASCDVFVAARTRPDWPIRLRRALGGRLKVKLPGAERVRDERGRFVSA